MRKHCIYTYESMLQNLPIDMVDKLPLRITLGTTNCMNVYLLGATAMNANKMIHEYKSHRTPAPSELNPSKSKNKPNSKIDDDIGLGAWSACCRS